MKAAPASCAMSLQDHESTLEQLTQEGARFLTVNPRAAGERFEQAHDLALELGDGPGLVRSQRSSHAHGT